MALSFFRKQPNPEAGIKTDQTAQAEISAYAVRACADAGAQYLTQVLVSAASRAEIDNTLRQVQAVKDRCAAFSSDDLDAAHTLSDRFCKAAFVNNDLGAAVGSLLIDASAIASGEEVDGHHPAENTGFNARELYT